MERMDQHAARYKTIPVGHGLLALVDEDDYERVTEYRWYVIKSPRIYVAAYISDFGIVISLHRFILMAPPGTRIDHRDGNPLNNRKENLRFCTPAQNAYNAVKSKANTSGFKGVSWNKRDQRWVAHIKYNSKLIHLGGFIDPVFAARAYDRAARHYHGSFARLNFPRAGEQKA